MTGYWPKTVFWVLPRRRQRPTITQKKKKDRTRPIPRHLDRRSLVNLFSTMTNCQIVRLRSLRQHRINYKFMSLSAH